VTSFETSGEKSFQTSKGLLYYDSNWRYFLTPSISGVKPDILLGDAVGSLLLKRSININLLDLKCQNSIFLMLSSFSLVQMPHCTPFADATDS